MLVWIQNALEISQSALSHQSLYARQCKYFETPLAVHIVYVGAAKYLILRAFGDSVLVKRGTNQHPQFRISDLHFLHSHLSSSFTEITLSMPQLPSSPQKDLVKPSVSRRQKTCY